MAHQLHENGNVFGREADATADASDQLHARFGVVARVALAEVVEPGGHEEDVRATDAVGQSRRLGGGLEEVPVDREAVIRIVLQLAANRLPLGKDSRQQTVLVKGLEDGNGRIGGSQ